MPVSPVDIILRCLGSLGLLAFAIGAYGSGIDRMAADSPDVASLVPAPFAANAMMVRAQKLALEGKLNQAEVAARAFVAAAPVDPFATNLLGQIELLRKRPDKAESAFTMAAQFGWRAPATQAYWVGRAVELGDYEVAAMHVAALFRTNRGIMRNFDFMRGVEQNPALRQAMLTRMAARPSWLENYVTDVQGFGDEQFYSRVSTIADLSAEGVQLGCEKISPIVNQLTGRNKLVEGAAIWRAHCPEVAGMITDPNFKYLTANANANTMYGWRLRTTGVLSYQALEGPQHLLAVTNSGPVNSAFLLQYLVVPVGHYRLRWYSAGKPSVMPHFGCDLTAIPMADNVKSAGDHWWTADIESKGYCTLHALEFFVEPGTENASFGQVSMQALS